MVEKLYDTLFLVWKTYHYSAKSCRDLSALGSELGVNVRVATNVKGTHWVPHVQRALEIFLKGVPRRCWSVCCHLLALGKSWDDI